jgi:hypothetical protein
MLTLEPIAMCGLPPGCSAQVETQWNAITQAIYDAEGAYESHRALVQQLSSSPTADNFEDQIIQAQREARHLRERAKSLRTKVGEFFEQQMAQETRSLYSAVAESIPAAREWVKKTLLKMGYSDPDVMAFGSYPADALVRHPRVRNAENLLNELFGFIEHMRLVTRENEAALSRLDAQIDTAKLRALSQA